MGRSTGPIGKHEGVRLRTSVANETPCDDLSDESRQAYSAKRLAVTLVCRQSFKILDILPA